ncbi:hypothetical protein Rhal01_03701 [Rubritalea halochordaticola]|uniref:DUF3592 domain-containing protein n=1 Tax=Rubritalea halochordaticola TaxID=714537 RepID=A0ABP9V4F9_9BACT
MIRKAFSILLLLLALCPVVINLCGWNIQLAYESENQEYSVAGMRGGIRLTKLKRLSSTYKQPSEEALRESIGYEHHSLCQLGPVSLEVNRATKLPPSSTSFRYFTFERSDPSMSSFINYITFPQIFLLAFTLLIILVLNHGELNKGRKAKKA